MKTIFTIGTSNRTLKDFGTILKVQGIQLLVDVRRFPTSTFEHFKQKNLAAFLTEEGIGYRWMGDSLGAFRSTSYEQHMKTEEFNRGLDLLEKLAEQKATAMCCAERLPWKCHRRFIAGELEKRNWEVLHILDHDDIWRPTQTELF